MINDQVVRITAKILKIRETMQTFWGDRYAERIEPFRDAIRRWTAESGKPRAEVALRVCQETERHGTGMDVLLAIAAFCEECGGQGGKDAE